MEMRQVCFMGLLLVVLVVGCSHRDSALPKLMPVSGVVTINGKPASGVTIRFAPIETTRGSGAYGFTDKFGKYELIACRGGKGAPVGEYQVVAEKLVMPDGSDFPIGSNIPPMESKARQILPDKYSNPTESTLKASVGEGLNTIDFSLSLNR